MKRREILITGGRGQLGIEFNRHRWPEGWTTTPTDRSSLDLADAAAIAEVIASRPWAAVINCAAYTAVDKAEDDPVAAWRANALGPAALAAATRAAGIPLLHVSTDYVFPGDRAGAWAPSDPVRPLGVYGASKEGGEQAVRTANPRHAIVRTAWVVSAHGNNFVRTMLRAGSEQSVLRVVADQYGAPTAASDLVAALAAMAIRMVDDPKAPKGTFHFSNAGATTWHGFATEIFVQAARRGGPSPRVEAITTADYPTSAKRPANSLLDCRRIEIDYGIARRPWQVALAEILDELVGRVRS